MNRQLEIKKILMETSNLEPGQDLAIHFKSLIMLLVDKFQPTRIISFGQQTLQNQIEGCFGSKEIKQQHHCLLICTESCTRIDYEIQDFVNTHYSAGQVTIICHGESTIKDGIDSNNRFFITVMTNGKPIYTKNGFFNIDTIPKFNPDGSMEKATKHFSHRISLANGFFECARESLAKGNYNITAFLLHQVVEQSCIGLIRVNIAYRSEFHNIYRLLGLCRSFSDAPFNILVGEKSSDRRLFDILSKSYGKARYASEFSVTRKDAEELYDKVSSFIELVESMCRNKIKTLATLTISE